MFPAINSSGQYFNIQSDVDFKPTVYRLSDPHVLQQRVFFLVAAGECLMLKYDEPTAAAVCMSVGHQFQCQIELEAKKAEGSQNIGSAMVFPGILSKSLQYNLVDFFTVFRQHTEFEVVKDSISPSARLPDVRQKEAKLLL